MSRENGEIVRRGYDAFNRGDLGAFLQALDPNVEWVFARGAVSMSVLVVVTRQ